MNPSLVALFRAHSGCSGLAGFVVAAVAATIIACSTTATSTTLDPTSPPNEAPCEGCDPAMEEDGARSPAPSSDASEDSDASAREDAALPDDASAPAVDPLCETAAFGLGAFGHASKSAALPVVFGPRILVGGLLSPGADSGNPSPRWFSFTVPAARDVDVSFSGLKAYAAFYFENEAESQFSVGYTVPRKFGVHLRAGVYYVKVADVFKRYFGAGPLFEVSITWSTPPSICLDGGP